jgi:hypothetical protein
VHSLDKGLVCKQKTTGEDFQKNTKFAGKQGRTSVEKERELMVSDNKIGQSHRDEKG